MKDPRKLQEKLCQLLKGTRIHIQFPENRPWTDLELKEIVGIIQDAVDRNTDVINYDPLKDWVEECRFYLTDLNRNRGGLK